MLLESPPPPPHKEHSYSLGGYRTSLVPHWGPLAELPRQHEEAPLSSCLSAGWARRVEGVVGNETHWGPPGSRWASSYLTQSPMGPGDPASLLPCLMTEGFIPLLRRKQASASWLDGGLVPQWMSSLGAQQSQALIPAADQVRTAQGAAPAKHHGRAWSSGLMTGRLENVKVRLGGVFCKQSS